MPTESQLKSIERSISKHGYTSDKYKTKKQLALAIWYSRVEPKKKKRYQYRLVQS